MKNRFDQWLDGDIEVLEHVVDASEVPDEERGKLRLEARLQREWLSKTGQAVKIENFEEKGFRVIYGIVAVVSCILLIGALLFTVANLPRYGVVNPETLPIVKRYVERGLEETGAINIVSGMILDYRAFDTLGESHVLFTALVCVTILLRIDRKNMRTGYEDFYDIRSEKYHKLSGDSIFKQVGSLLVPCIFLYGIYVLLNGQNSPGGGFSGGAVMGTGLIIASSSLGFKKIDTFFTAKVSMITTFCALGFYCLAKGYVFFTGANGMENHIPKGTPGAILSGGLILPLDIAVGIVVACTMFGFYSLFRRGSIGGDAQ